jgi:mevalonate kinase
VRRRFADSKIWADFAQITDAFEASEGKVESLFSAIQDNHQLLNEIGVVPTDVVQLIEKIERLGGAAKICGAGAHTGQSAGQILVFLPDQNVDEISEKIGISLIPLEQQSDGAYRE